MEKSYNEVVESRRWTNGIPSSLKSEHKIIIICTEEQENYIRQFGCIANDDDLCDADFCSSCPYDSDKIEFRRH